MEIRRTNGRCYIDGRRVSKSQADQLFDRCRMFGQVDSFVTTRKGGRVTHIVQVRP